MNLRITSGQVRKNNYILYSTKGINTIGYDVPLNKFYFVHYDKNGMSISIWKYSQNMHVKPNSIKLETHTEFLFKRL